MYRNGEPPAAGFFAVVCGFAVVVVFFLLAAVVVCLGLVDAVLVRFLAGCCLFRFHIAR